MDYNKLMMELESCLGLETPAMESIKSKGQEKVAFEEYDEVEKELAAELGVKVPATEGVYLGEGSETYDVEDEIFNKAEGEVLPRLMEEWKKAHSGKELTEEIEEKLSDRAFNLVKRKARQLGLKIYNIKSEEKYNNIVSAIDDMDVSSILSKSSTEGVFFGKGVEVYDADDDLANKSYELADLLIEKWKKSHPNSELTERTEEKLYDRAYNLVDEEVYRLGVEDIYNIGTEEELDKIVKIIEGIDVTKLLPKPRKSAKESGEEDIVFSEEGETSEPAVEPNPEEEPDPKEIFKEQVKTFFNSLDMEPEEAMKVINEVMAEALDCGECKPEEGEEGELDIQSLDEISTAEEGCNKEPAKEECGKKEEAKEEKKEEPVSEEEGSAFEEFSAKMLNRYKSLAAKEGFGSGSKVANEGIGEISICESAIDRTSCEFNYSGENLRKMVKEAIETGII